MRALQNSTLCLEQVHHVRQPGQGVPIAGLHGRKGPDHPFEGQSALDLRVIINIRIIIEVDEVMIS